jgi:lipoprotein-anchoring transpeptidase ErfK/SrfK
MTRRRLYVGFITLLVVGIVSSFGATRVWSESSAHAQYMSAQTSAHGALAAAREDGLTGQELATANRTIRTLDRAQAPDTLPVFGSGRSDFYSRQAREYRAAQARLAVTVRRVTRATGAAAAAALRTLQGDIQTAGGLGLDTSADESALRSGRSQQATARTPKEFRAVSASVSTTDRSLKSVIAARQAAVNAVLAADHDSLSAIQTSARTSVDGLRPSLSLLALVNRRGNEDLAELDKQVQAIAADGQISDAAVKTLELTDAVNSARKDVAGLLPAKMIVVSTENQSATMYQGGTQVYSTPVTTGGPELPTDHGVFHIYMKAPNFTFHSPWPPGSPYYYPPTFVQYWMPFYGGEGLHDASWRSNFGPGSNLQPTNLGTGNYILGTHGCVNLPTAAAAWVWNWAPLGTTVVVT